MRAVLLALLISPSVARAEAPSEQLTFQGAIELALSKSPELAAAQQTVAAAAAREAGTKAQRLPSLHLDMSGNYYRQPYSLPFGTQVFTLHERQTSATILRVMQPLTGLAYLSELVGAASHDARAAIAEYDKARLDVAYTTSDAYIRVLEARATADVAHRSVADLEAELDQAKKLRAADTATNIDVLRIQSALSASQQNAVRADAAAQVALASLVVTIGLPEGTTIDLKDDLPATPPPMAMSIDAALARAVQARPELRAARERVDAAQNVVRSKQYEYLPDVRAVGVWTHLTGVQPFEPEDEEYAGVTLSWNLWNWGATHQAVREAEANRSKAQVAVGSTGDNVRLDVRRHFLDAKASFDNLAAAKVQLDSAEEAYRLTHVKYENGAATTTDVIDAETEVARARLRFAIARYDYYLGLVGLARSMGDLPAVH